MRKVLFAILALILLIVSVMIIYRGTSIGKFNIWGIKQIVEENETIEQANDDLITLIDVKYKDALTKLENSGEKMQETKKEYEEQAVMVSNSKYFMQTEKYKLEFLWTRIGNYAKDNNVTPKMDVTSGTTKGVYNLVITAVGKYPDVASFIYAIENDSRLGFKVEDFSMTQASIDGKTNYVQGKFTCKEIKIDIKSIDSESSSKSSETTSSENDDSKANTTNTTDTTDTNNTNTNSNTVGNTTNTTNTVNTNTTNNTDNTVNTTTT